MTPLWDWPALTAITDAAADDSPSRPITGLSIDTRTLQPGDLFVALKDQRDGHDFVTAAFKAGAAAALVEAGYGRRPGDGALLRVKDPLVALEEMGRVARFRGTPKVIAITGSAGKTGTKEALRMCLARVGRVHASEKSYNNHWGVPLTLARMPVTAEYGVFEIGMNHAGEITPLTRMVCPEVAIVTTVEPVHLGHFASVEDIAEAKAEIFSGLEPEGIAILNRDNPYFATLKAYAIAARATIITFGANDGCDVQLVSRQPSADGSDVVVSAFGKPVSYRIGAPGDHYVRNSLAIVAALDAVGANLSATLPALAEIGAPAGRGQRTALAMPGGTILLIDESYNANPASMRAALQAMSTTSRAAYARRIVVLGDMLELGPASAKFHSGLTEPIEAAGVDLVFAVGPMMRHMFDRLPASRQAGWVEKSEDLADAVKAMVQAGDAVMVKGSLGTNMAPLVRALKGLTQS
jgi:UDP-N-acetylmuramoyl-tripeptide--D-alanyl-D-alanine ligase